MSDPTVIRLSTPEDLIQAVPHWLGYQPYDSLVAVALQNSRVQCTARVDTPAPDATAPVAAALAECVARDGATSAVIVLVTDHPRPDLLRAAASALQRHGVEVSGPFWAETTRPGARWSCLCDRTDCTLGGTLPHDGGQMAAEMAFTGRVVHPDRATVLALLEPGDRAALDRRAALLAEQPTTEVLRPGTIPIALAAHRGGEPVADQVVVDMVNAARTSHGFTELVSLALTPGDHGLAVAEFLLMLARETPPAAVSEIATVAGLAQYLAGDAVLARAALQRALHADSTAVIPAGLLAMLDNFVPPTELRAWISDANRP